jgi:hypothetical protein
LVFVIGIGLLWWCERAKEGERVGIPARIGLASTGRDKARDKVRAASSNAREHACKGQ